MLFSVTSLGAFFIESQKITLYTAVNTLLILSIFLIKPKIPIKLYPSAGMYVRITITTLLAGFLGWFMTLFRIFNQIQIKRNPYNQPVLILLIGAIISYPRILDHRVYLIWFTSTLYLLIVIELQFYILENTTYTEHHTYILGAIVSLFIIITIANLLLKNYDTTSVIFFERSKGIFTNPNSLGIFSAVGTYLLIAYGIKNKNTIIRLILFIFILILIYLVRISVSRNAVLSLGIASATFVFLALNKRGSKFRFFLSFIFSLLTLAVLVLVFLKFTREFSFRFETALKGKEASALLRLLMAKHTLRYIVTHPINVFIGSGPYQFYHYTFSYGLAGPHNIIIDWWFSFGIFGLTAILLFLYFTYIKPLKFIYKQRTFFSSREYLYRVSLVSAMTAFWASTLLDEVFWAIHHTILYQTLPFIITTIPYLIIEEPPNNIAQKRTKIVSKK